jgi:hypothetical protein
LRLEAAKQIVLDMDIQGLKDADGNDLFDKLNQKVDEFKNKDIAIGASLDDTDFIQTLNDMLKNGQITAE